jgi:hypothetical protein
VQKAKALSLFPFSNSFIYLYEIFHFIKFKLRKTKYVVEKGENKMMDDEVREKNKQNAIGGRKAEMQIWDNYRFTY